MNGILGVAGSPRKNGNTHVLVSRILEGAKEAGAEVELLLLADLNIRECDGCLLCWQGKPCPKNDDMNDLYPKIAEAGAIVFGTPVYWFGPTALMKAFLDRFVYFNCPANRGQVRGKPAVVATPFEDETPETADLLLALFAKSFEYLEMRPAGRIIVPGVGGRGDVLQKQAALDEAHELGRKLAAIARQGA